MLLSSGERLVEPQRAYRPRFIVTADGALLLRRVAPRDAGSYRCSGAGDLAEHVSNVTVSPRALHPVPPVVTLAPTNRSVIMSDTITFKCPYKSRDVSGGDVTVTWYKDEGATLDVAGARIIMLTSDDCATLRIYQTVVGTET